MSANRVIDPRAAEKRRSLLITFAAVMALVVIAAGVIIWAVNRGDSGSGGTAVPTAGVTTDDAIRVSAAPAGTTPPVVITVTEDFQCPACKSFEELMGPTLNSFKDNPQVAVDYVAINMLDSMSSTEYSTRAANASMCVAENTGKDGDFATWMKFHNALFVSQPAEGGAGLSDSQIISIAKESGVEGVDSCIKNVEYRNWIDETSAKAMSQPGFEGTPSVRINGDVVQLSTPDDLQARVNAILEGAK
ncbi:DsbA family protein [Gordonia alkaliphila]|uniref:Thioredoxin domain-containing protein n=1 Tax=Gordonia alkaliphila TaxID=1053547 RepID=A0ABP8ZDM0_9ACTN